MNRQPGHSDPLNPLPGAAGELPGAGPAAAGVPPGRTNQSRKKSCGKIGVLVALVVAALSGAGCASVFKGPGQAIPITSDPPGAEVWLDDKMIGFTPLTAEVRRKSDHLITIGTEGYLVENVPVIRKMGGAIAGNILLGYIGLIGAGIDAGTGAMYNLTPEAIRVKLKPDSAALPKTPVAESSAARFIEELRKLDSLLAAKSIAAEEYAKMRQALVDQYAKQ